MRRVECIRFRVGGDGYESPIDDDENDEDAGGEVRETFDVSFAVSFGGLSGEWLAKGLSATAESADARESGEEERLDAAPGAWKGKFLDAQRKLWEKEGEVERLKDRILEAVL